MIDTGDKQNSVLKPSLHLNIKDIFFSINDEKKQEIRFKRYLTFIHFQSLTGLKNQKIKKITGKEQSFVPCLGSLQ